MPFRSVRLATLLLVTFTVGLGAGPAQAAKHKKHHKRSAPSHGGKAAAPDSGDDSGDSGAGSAGSSSSSGSSSDSSDSTRPTAEPESSSSGGSDEAAPPAKRKKTVKMQDEATAEAPSAPSGLPWLDLSLGLAIFNRNLTFHQDADPPGNQLNPYSLPAWPVGVLDGVLYLEPVASALGNLGLEGHAMQGFGVSSKFSNSSTSFSSTVHDYSGGIRYRFPFGVSNLVFISGRYGEDAFTFNGTNRSSLRTPDTIYHYGRAGLGVQWALGSAASLSLGAGYRLVTNKGGPQISGQFFPRLAVAGADAQAALTYAFSDVYALRAGIDWRRYWFDFHVRNGDNFLVGGAVDQSFLFSVSLVLTIGGTPHAEAEAEPAPAKAKPAKAKPNSDDSGSSEGGSDDSDSGKKSGGSDDI